MLKKTAVALAAATIALAGCDGSNNVTAASGVTFYVSDGASIYTITDGDTLNASEKALTGLNSGTLLYSIDANPRGGVVTGFGSDGQVYSVDTATGTLVKTAAADSTLSLNGKAVEIDYNPRAGAGTASEGHIFRVTTSTGENYRRNDGPAVSGGNPGTPATFTAGRDTSFSYKTGDLNTGKSVVVSGLAYTNSQLNTPATLAMQNTTAFVIDSQNDVLARLGAEPANGISGDPGNPNSGVLTTIGTGLGVDVSGFVGFDILGPTTAFATAFKDGAYNLYSVDLVTGKMSFITVMNPKIQPVRTFAVQQK